MNKEDLRNGILRGVTRNGEVFLNTPPHVQIIGAGNFDLVLSNSVQDAIRQRSREVRTERAYDLRGSDVKDMQDLLNNKHLWVPLMSGYPQVSEPPDTSTFVRAVEVSLAVQQDLSFSSMFLSTVPIISVTARGVWSKFTSTFWLAAKTPITVTVHGEPDDVVLRRRV